MVVIWLVLAFSKFVSYLIFFLNGILIDWREEKSDTFHLTSLLDLPTGTVELKFPDEEFFI